MSEDNTAPNTEAIGQPNTSDENIDLAAIFKGFSDAVMERVEARLNTPTPTTPEQMTDTATTPSTLTQRIVQLEKQLAEKAEAETRQARQQSLDTSLKRGLNQFDLAFPSETTDIVKGLFGGQVEEVEGKWLSKDGKSLDEHINAFFATPFGQHLLKAPSNQAGSGTRGTTAPRQQSQTSDAKTAIGKLFGLA